MEVLKAFIVGVIVGLIVYIIAGAVPFLAAYQGVLALLAFLIAVIVSYQGGRV